MITPAQHAVYDFIQAFIEEHGYSPSLVEIAEGIGVSPKSVSLISRQIHALVAAGRLKRDKKGYRRISLVGQEGLVLPLMGRIAAGSPIEAIEDKQTIDIGAMLQGSDHYVLEVRGDSMVEEGIFDGDLVICKQAEEAREGDIVVALIDQQEATLKRLSYKARDKVTLIPANQTMKPKTYLPHRVRIQGIFVGLLRIKNL